MPHRFGFGSLLGPAVAKADAGPLTIWDGWTAWPLIRCVAGFTAGMLV